MTSSSGTKRWLPEGHEPAEDRRHLDPGEVLLAGLGVAHEDGEVEREPGDVGERVGRVDRQRRQHREDPLLEQPLAELLLLAVEVGPPDQLDALLGQAGHQLVAEQPGVPLHLVAGLGPDPLEHVARHQAGRGADGDVGGDAALEAGHADHEELVEVAGEDRREAHALEQGQVGVLGLAEHAPAVGEPGQLTVEEPVVVRRDRGERLLVGHVWRLDVERLVGGRRRRVRGRRRRAGPWGQCGTEGEQRVSQHSARSPTALRPRLSACLRVDVPRRCGPAGQGADRCVRRWGSPSGRSGGWPDAG